MDIWHMFNYPNVIRMFGASHLNLPSMIVSEYPSNGHLASYLKKSDASKRRMWRLLLQAAQGLDYAHKLRVVHGNLKLNNILVGSDGFAKLSDFGLSAIRTCSSASASKAGVIAGTLHWRASECLRSRPTFASDVYSFSMCIIEAVTDRPPFSPLFDDDVRVLLKKGVIPEKPKAMSDEAYKLVVSMSRKSTVERIPLSSVLAKLEEIAKAKEAADCDYGDDDDLNCGHCFASLTKEHAFCGICGSPTSTTNSTPEKWSSRSSASFSKKTMYSSASLGSTTT